MRETKNEYECEKCGSILRIEEDDFKTKTEKSSLKLPRDLRAIEKVTTIKSVVCPICGNTISLKAVETKLI